MSQQDECAGQRESALPKLGTREQLRQFLIEEGYPITAGTMNQMCAPARGEGPPVEGYWGRRAVYDFRKGLEWARGRLRQKPYAIHPVSGARCTTELVATE
jgi:hypothetical protein